MGGRGVNGAGGMAAATDGGNGCGGGIYTSSDCNSTIENCSILANTASGGNAGDDTSMGASIPTDGGDGYGGGLYCSTASITACTISENQVTGGKGGISRWSGGSGGKGRGGGAYCNSGGQAAIENCVIANNTIQGGNGGDLSDEFTDGGPGGHVFGGGVYCGPSNIQIVNCAITGSTISGGNGADTVSGNSGDGGEGFGAGVYCVSANNSTISNCSIADNTASGGSAGTGGGSATIGADGNGFGGGVYCDTGSTVTITDAILWGDSPSEVNGSPTVSDSDVQGGFPGGTNIIDADPCFVSGPEGDYYLSQIAAGQGSDSPCVDAGSVFAVILGMNEGTTRTDEVNDVNIVDMGYHYGTPTYIPQPNAEDCDIDGDLDVDADDFAILGEQWQQVPGVPSADIWPVGGDGIVGENDLGLLIYNWLWQE